MTVEPVGADYLTGVFADPLIENRLVKQIVTNGVDDAAQLNAAISALGSAGGTIRLAGNIKLGSVVTFPQGVGLVGTGQNMSGANVPGSRITLLNATSGLRFTGSGGVTQGFTVEGGNVATTPIKIELGSQRVFIGVEAENSAQDNWVIEEAQNHIFVGCCSQGAARDNLVLDVGTGGHLFEKFNANDAGRYNLRVSERIANPGGYPTPTHINFVSCIFERQAGDNSTLFLEEGAYLRFEHCIFTGNNTGSPVQPVVSWTSQYSVEFASCRFFGATTNTAVKSTSTGRMVFSGMNEFYSSQYAFDASAGSIYLQQYPILNTGVALASPATNVAQRFTDKKISTIWSVQPTTSGVVADINIDGDAGRRLRITGDGKLNYGDGTGFSFSPVVGRVADGAFGPTVNTHVLVTGRNTTANRPSAATVGAGALYFDTTLGRLIVSDGTNWRDLAPDVQEFTSSGTWNKPTGAKTVDVILMGSGGGGGAGRRGAAGTVRCGGGGGSGGGLTRFTFDAADLPSSVSVTIGAAGTGAAAQGTNDTDGATGGNGNVSTFGTLLWAGAGNGGGGGTATAGAAGAAPSSMFPTNSGGAASGTGGAGGNAGATYGGGGGGAGGGITSGNAASAGGQGVVTRQVTNAGVNGGVVDSTAPSSGTAPTGKGLPGPGGGGGAGSITTTAQTGAAPNGVSGGGGGGGASLNGNNSGAGGNGAAGYCRVVTHF